MREHRKQSFLRRHSLSIVAIAVVAALIVLYLHADEKTHLGSFFGNAIADWTGVLVTVIGTKYLYERGSAESRKPKPVAWFGPLHEFIHEHSLTFFLLVTGIFWVALFAHMDSEGKWGAVVGNIVSEWTQTLGLVLLTKGLFEERSKESKKD